MKLCIAILTAGALVASSSGAAPASAEDAPTPLEEGHPGAIGTLVEAQFYVDGSADSARRFTFSNGARSLYFIPMIHQAEPAFYAAVAGEVRRLKALGAELFYEFIDFDAASLDDKRRIRAMLGFLPSPSFYADNLSDGLVAQDNSAFLGFPGGDDNNVDVTPGQLADAYEELIGPLAISEENLATPIDSFVMPTADPAKITSITIDWRSRHLARAIDQAPGDVVALYGAAHVAETVRELQQLDPRWHRAD